MSYPTPSEQLDFIVLPLVGELRDHWVNDDSSNPSLPPPAHFPTSSVRRLATRHWPAFRGTGDSVSNAKQLPLKWSATENIAWTTDLPGYGRSSPVVWKNKVFVTAVDGDYKDTPDVFRIDIATGKGHLRLVSTPLFAKQSM